MIFDFANLESFTKHDPIKMKRYIHLYLEVAKNILVQMEENLDKSEWEQLRINAHSWKSQVDFMGIKELKEVLAQIEENIVNGQLDNLKSLYETSHTLHLRSEQLLNKKLIEISAE